MDQDYLFQQMTNISKAHAFDIVSQQVGELKAIINKLIEVGELEDLTFTDPADTHEFQTIVKIAKIAAL